MQYRRPTRRFTVEAIENMRFRYERTEPPWRVLDPSREDIFDAAEKLGADMVYFTMVFQAATAIAPLQRYEARLARQPMIMDSPTVAILRDVARFTGWL